MLYNFGIDADCERGRFLPKSDDPSLERDQTGWQMAPGDEKQLQPQWNVPHDWHIVLPTTYEYVWRPFCSEFFQKSCLFVPETHIKLSYEDDGQKYHQTGVDAKQIINSSFVRHELFTGLFGVPNTFFLHVDENFAVLYYCQSSFIFFHKSDVIVLSRVRKTTLKDFYPKLDSILVQNGIKRTLSKIEQPRLCSWSNQNQTETN